MIGKKFNHYQNTTQLSKINTWKIKDATLVTSRAVLAIAAISLILLLDNFAAARQTWTGVGPEGGDIRTLVIDSHTPQTIYAGTRQGGVFKSTNGGRSWSAINSGLPPLSTVQAVAIDPSTPQTIFASSGGGLVKSTDGGNNWSFDSRSRQPVSGVESMAIDPSTPQTIFAGTGSGVFKSMDGGSNWTTRL